MEDFVYKEFLDLEARHWWFIGRRAIFVSLLDRYVGMDGSGRKLLMDVGCGVGGMLTPLAAYGRVIGTDVTFKGLEHCARRGFPRLVASHGPQAPFRSEAFDAITAFDALEHIEDDVGTLREIRRMLKPGGVLVASGPAYQFLYAQQDKNTHHFRRYDRGELVAKAREAGLEVLQASYINFLLFPVILPVVLLLRLVYLLGPKVIDPKGGSNVSIPVPGWLHGILAGIFRSEARLLRWFDAPAGHSLVMVARRPA